MQPKALPIVLGVKSTAYMNVFLVYCILNKNAASRVYPLISVLAASWLKQSKDTLVLYAHDFAHCVNRS